MSEVPWRMKGQYIKNCNCISAIVLYSWPGALHQGNGTVQPFIEKKASEEQRNALLTILSGQGGNREVRLYRPA